MHRLIDQWLMLNKDQRPTLVLKSNSILFFLFFFFFLKLEKRKENKGERGRGGVSIASPSAGHDDETQFGV